MYREWRSKQLQLWRRNHLQSSHFDKRERKAVTRLVKKYVLGIVSWLGNGYGINVVEVTGSAARELLSVEVLKAAGFNISDNWKSHCMNVFFYKHVLLFGLNKTLVIWRGPSNAHYIKVHKGTTNSSYWQKSNKVCICCEGIQCLQDTHFFTYSLHSSLQGLQDSLKSLGHLRRETK